MTGTEPPGGAEHSGAGYPWLPDPGWAPVAPFWSAAGGGRLAFPRCGGCGRFQWYPQDMCPDCRAMAYEWTDVDPRGYVFSHTVLRRSFMPEFTARLPVDIVLVKFAHVPGVTLITNVLDPPSDGVRIDAEVTIEFPEVAPATRLPMARIAGGAV